MIESFDDLLDMARNETAPVRLLTTLVRADAVMQAGADGNEVSTEGEGVLAPVMVKDHAVTGDLDFARLRDEADAGNDSWTFMMVGVLPGHAGRPPAQETIDEQLKNMARAIHAGSGLDRYLFFDRDGEPVQIGLAGA